MLDRILQQFLTPAHRAAGLSLRSADDNIILMRDGTSLDAFDYRLTVAAIQYIADQHMPIPGISFEKVTK